jgi:hypothetical protein
MKKITALISSSVLFLVSGCIPSYTLVAPGMNSVDTLYVVAGSGWNKAPTNVYSGDRKTSERWTQDGLLLNQLVFIPAVADGETLIVSQQKDAALPRFRKDMLPNEIEELAQSTFVKRFGEGNAVVTTSNLRPHRFGEQRGILFDVEAVVTESPQYRGLAGAFVADEKLYFIYYLGAVPYYHDRYRDQAEATIMSARLTPPAAQE